ncbi:MAG: (2Fe-2S)-binding protein [Ignisphaera sp.]|jgi:bacterioferritin-associated ferredoxin|nr:(2Fe-2S)-binding protein [Ignisphaera sp.]
MDKEVNRKPVIICRCNDVTLDDIVEAVKAGIDDFEVLRRYLRIGFGPCQGRSCILLAARIFARLTGKRVDEVLANYRVRPPIVPVPARHVVAGVEE